jgi:hypothetical protein
LTFSANLASPGPRVEGVCEPVTITIGSDMQGSPVSASTVIGTALGLGFPVLPPHLQLKFISTYSETVTEAPVTQVWCIFVDHNFQRTLGNAFPVNVPSDGRIYNLTC